jgi:predicted metal-dependent hydrolase
MNKGQMELRQFTYQDIVIDYHIQYKKRKSLGIYIDVYGNIELRVPKETKDIQIQKLLEDKHDWIITKQREMKEKTKGFKEKEYKEGEAFLYLGRQIPIRIIEDVEHKGEEVVLKGDELHIYLIEFEELKVQQLLKRFYYKQCKALVEERIRIYQPNFKVKPKSVKISDNKKTWGTCNNHRELTFNWKLSMAPIDVIDYVVLHEMCHLVHLNHDRSFWRLLGKFIPDYEEKQEWLSQSHWKMVV